MLQLKVKISLIKIEKCQYEENQSVILRKQDNEESKKKT